MNTYFMFVLSYFKLNVFRKWLIWWITSHLDIYLCILLIGTTFRPTTTILLTPTPDTMKTRKMTLYFNDISFYSGISLTCLMNKLIILHSWYDYTKYSYICSFKLFGWRNHEKKAAQSEVKKQAENNLISFYVK